MLAALESLGLLTVLDLRPAPDGARVVDRS
jgi:hypothetical protein